MEQINHHLNDSLLMGYASGNLPEAFSLVVATHISLCDECRARLASFDAVGGALIDDGSTIEMDEESLAATFALIANSPAEPKREAPTKDTVFPSPLQGYVGGDLDKVRWRALGGGVKQAVLNTSSKATVRLLQIPAGAAMPDHGHRGTELTLVLKGRSGMKMDVLVAATSRSPTKTCTILPWLKTAKTASALQQRTHPCGFVA